MNIILDLLTAIFALSAGVLFTILHNKETKTTTQELVFKILAPVFAILAIVFGTVSCAYNMSLFQIQIAPTFSDCFAALFMSVASCVLIALVGGIFTNWQRIRTWLTTSESTASLIAKICMLTCSALAFLVFLYLVIWGLLNDIFLMLSVLLSTILALCAWLGMVICLIPCVFAVYGIVCLVKHCRNKN